MESSPDAIPAIERTLFNTLLDVTGRARFEVYGYRGRVVVFRLLNQAKRLHDEYAGAVAWLEAAAAEFSKILIDEEYFSPSESSIFAMSVEEMKTDMRNKNVDLANLTIADLGIYASPDAALKLASLHYSKGREYGAVAMIDLHEGRIPFYLAQSDKEIGEAKRLFYVGVTRAKRVLCYITDSSNSRNEPTRFLRVGTGVGVC